MLHPQVLLRSHAGVGGRWGGYVMLLSCRRAVRREPPSPCPLPTAEQPRVLPRPRQARGPHSVVHARGSSARKGTAAAGRGGRAGGHACIARCAAALAVVARQEVGREGVRAARRLILAAQGAPGPLPSHPTRCWVSRAPPPHAPHHLPSNRRLRAAPRGRRPAQGRVRALQRDHRRRSRVALAAPAAGVERRCRPLPARARHI